MEKKIYPIWGIIYVICVMLGLLSQRNTVLDILFTVISVGFFIPGVILLVNGYKTGNRKTLVHLRLVSLSWLVLTCIALLLCFLSATSSSETLITVLHYILAIVSAPMLCSSFWVLPIFLWSCLFIASFPKIAGITPG